jgi:hypothetical protein
MRFSLNEAAQSEPKAEFQLQIILCYSLEHSDRISNDRVNSRGGYPRWSLQALSILVRH